MIKNSVLKILKNNICEIKQYGIEEISIFGSVARNQDTPNSDIDILIKFKDKPTFDIYMDLKFYLEDLLERKVDLVTEGAVRPELRHYMDEDLIRVA